MVFPKGPPVDISGLQDLMISNPTRLQPVAAPEFCGEHGGDVDVKICPTKRRFFHCKKVSEKVHPKNGRKIQVFRIYNYCPNIVD